MNKDETDINRNLLLGTEFKAKRSLEKSNKQMVDVHYQRPEVTSYYRIKDGIGQAAVKDLGN